MVELKSEKQKVFCLEYVRNGGNATEAYKKAGYLVKSEGAARACASRLLTDANVIARLKEIELETNTPKILSIQQRKEILSQFVTDSESSKMVKLKSIDLLNKMDSVYVQRQEIQGAIPVVLTDNVRE